MHILIILKASFIYSSNVWGFVLALVFVLHFVSLFVCCKCNSSPFPVVCLR